jgi:uncharacterized protein
MAPLTHLFDLASLRLRPGQGRRIALSVPLEGMSLGGQDYDVQPPVVPVQLEVSRMAGPGYALRMIFDASLCGPCMRCLKDAGPALNVDVREVDVPGAEGDLDSPYVQQDTLDLASWARDAFVLAVPVAVLCREDCRGLCPVCAVDLNEAGPEHFHESGPDPRWAKLRELELE